MTEGTDAAQEPVSTPLVAPAPPQGPYLRPGAEPPASAAPVDTSPPTQAVGPSTPRRGRAVRVLGGAATVVFVIGLKLFAAVGVTHLLRGSSAGVVFVAVILIGFLIRYATRFLGR